MEAGKYLNLWIKYLPVVKIKLKQSLRQKETLALSKMELEAVGDRGI